MAHKLLKGLGVIGVVIGGYALTSTYMGHLNIGIRTIPSLSWGTDYVLLCGEKPHGFGAHSEVIFCDATNQFGRSITMRERRGYFLGVYSEADIRDDNGDFHPEKVIETNRLFWRATEKVLEGEDNPEMRPHQLRLEELF